MLQLTPEQIDLCIETVDAAIKNAKKEADDELQYGKSILGQCKAIKRWGDLDELQKELKKRRKKVA